MEHALLIAIIIAGGALMALVYIALFMPDRNNPDDQRGEDQP